MKDSNKETLALLESRLAAMEASSDGIGIVDSDGRVTYMNRSLKKLYGLTDESAQNYIGKPWGQFYTTEARKDIEDKILPSLKEKGYWRGENIVVRAGGELVKTELSLTSLSDGGFIGTARDVSYKERAEKEKQDLEDQFYQAQKMEAMGRLAGGIAHDFNNILAAMNGYTEFLLEDLEEDSPPWTFARNILQAGMQARELVDQMLTFSRRHKSAKKPVDLKKPVEESVTILAATLPKTIGLEQDINKEEVFCIEGNESQLTQTIMNLCVNAVDSIADEHGLISIALEEVHGVDIPYPAMYADSLPDAVVEPVQKIEDVSPMHTRLYLGGVAKDIDYVVLRVTDTGSGMPRQIMEHVFEPFFTTKQVDKGTGLGLATVHGMIIAHGGAMVVDTTLNEGTTFCLYFPRAEACVEHIKKEGDVSGGNIQHAAVLLVEDQAAVREMLMTMLNRLGCDAYVCEDGVEGLAVIRENPGAFDLVITDQNMPRMTGLEMIAQAHIDFPDLPFIVLSGYSPDKLQVMLDEHEAIKEVMRKPVKKNELQQKIEAVLHQSNKKVA